MKLQDVQQILEAELVWNTDCGDQEVSSGHASDLISDMLTCCVPGSLLLTGLTNSQVIRTAEILDLAAICFVRGKKPQPETIELAKEKGMPLFVTQLLMYESCGRLYSKGLAVGAR